MATSLGIRVRSAISPTLSMIWSASIGERDGPEPVLAVDQRRTARLECVHQRRTVVFALVKKHVARFVLGGDLGPAIGRRRGIEELGLRLLACLDVAHDRSHPERS